MAAARAVYVVGGTVNFKPPEPWDRLARAGEAALEAARERGELEPLYGTALLFAGFEALAAEAARLGLDLARVGSIELGLSYPKKLCGLDEAAAVEDFQRRLASSGLDARLRRGVRVRLRPTSAASASGMVPMNDAIGSVAVEGHDLALVVAGGNVKGTQPSRARLSVDESTEVLGSLISPLDRKLTGATMLKLAAVTLARAYQHDFDLVPAVSKHVREQRLSVHRRAGQGDLSVHVGKHPDEIPDRLVWEPMRLAALAPQSMGYSGLILSGRPEGPAPARVVGAGAGIEPSSIRHRPDMLAGAGMRVAMERAAEQARVRDWSRLWLFEAHNPFPGVILAELGRLLEWRGDRMSVSEALLGDRAGALEQPFLVSPAGGALAGHPIAPTTVRLMHEARRQLAAGHPAGQGPQEGVSYGAVSAVGGHHTFDGFFLLASGRPEELAALESGLEPFAHDELDARVRADHAAEAALDGVPDPGALSLVCITRSEADREGRRGYLGLAVDARGHHFPLQAPPEVFEALLAQSYVGTPVRLDGKLRLRASGPDAFPA
jgi:hypothetical protein